jgi:hypothetical protein
MVLALEAVAEGGGIGENCKQKTGLSMEQSLVASEG